MAERDRSLQIEEDLTFQRHQMRFERIGWTTMGAILVAALCGLLGNGVLSDATAGDEGDPFRVRYERLDRTSNPTSLTIELSAAAASAGQARVAVDRAWVDEVTIESVAPEPESVEVGADRLVYIFAVQPDAEAVDVTFVFEYENWGWKAGEIGLDGGPTHDVGMFVFP